MILQMCFKTNCNQVADETIDSFLCIFLVIRCKLLWAPGDISLLVQDFRLYNGVFQSSALINSIKHTNVYRYESQTVAIKLHFAALLW